MSAKPKPDRAGPSSSPTPPRYQGASAEDRAWMDRLVKAGHVKSLGANFGKPLDEDDELLKPGPDCPGAVEALIAERRSGL